MRHKSFLFFVLIFIKSTTFSQPPQPNISQNKAISNPYLPKTLTLYKNGFIVGYDGKNRSPSWVYERLTEESIKGSEGRANFFEDKEVPKVIRSLLSDYNKSGYDRGHMSPAGNHIATKAEMKDSFALSNMCPQHPACNRGVWKSLEDHVRLLTTSYVALHVISGTAYIPKTNKDGSRYVYYRVIGSNDVGIPTHLWKVIFAEKKSGKVDSYAYLIPNDESVKGKKFDDYKSSIEKIERVSGFLFSK